MLTDRVCPTVSTMPVCSNMLKPLSFAGHLVRADREVA